jgi:uncharacterized protein YyaL (SSP411 family)
MMHPSPALLTLVLALGPAALLSSGCDPTDPRESALDVAAPVRVHGDPRLPGVERIDEALQARLDRALAMQGSGYAPRTRHLRADGSPRFTNRLIEESSPYLLQHAHNPVNWYPWSAEAFDRAKSENKPIFLSVGYATCHWCHVMERESFEDEEIAAFLNRHFIAIKVDREERPDVDSVYMAAVNLLTGRGGWPMTIIMTPGKEPFFGGTYFPPRRGVRGARAGLVDILAQMLALYRNDPEQVVARAQEISQAIERSAFLPSGPGVPGDATIAAAANQLASSFDRVDGGFTGAPKFPQPSRLSLLLRYARRARDPGGAAIVTTTLDRMAAGGIYDHVGGGFHRYATDAQWLVPHFEKMLYDNAQLAVLYLEAWQHTGNADYLRVTREILDYVAREMTSKEGAFYSATDADSPAPGGRDQEGWYFTWTKQELDALLDPESAGLVSAMFGVTEAGNFEGRNVLHRVKSNRQLGAALGIPPARVADIWDSARGTLYEARALRPAPLRDDKIIASWNGMMISAFARAGWALAEPSYVDIAARAATFVLSTMRDETGGLLRIYRDGVTAEASFLDDHALMVQACLDLYETVGDSRWLRAALALQAEQEERFADREGGGYFLTPADGERLLVREKPAYDEAVPSANSVAAKNLLRFHDITGEIQWRERAERLFAALALRVTRSPASFPALLAALDHYYDAPLEIAIIVRHRIETGMPLANRVRRTFLPNKVFLLLSEAEAKRQEATAPWLEGKRAIGGRPTAYVCERGRCDLPTPSPHELAKQIQKLTPYPSFEKTSPPRLPFERTKR